jgi:type VI secretion system protein ImpC
MFPNDANFESEFTFENSAVPLPEEPPFHILFLGDWSGNSNRKDLDERKPFVVDRDNFDEVLKRLNVRLDLDLYDDGNSLLPLQFSELDDFHPDNLFRSVPLFSDLRDVRRRLANPDTFDSAANEVRSWFDSNDESFAADSEIQSQMDDAPPIESDNLLDMILTQPSASTTAVKPQNLDNSELGRFVSKIVSPYLIKIDENEQSKLIAAVDETISELMRNILHQPKFQALESAWRGLYFLVRRLETGSDLKVFILDVFQEELTDNLKSVNDLTDSFLYRQFFSQSFAVVAGNYSFGINIDDVATLMRVGKLANVGNAPFISYIKPEIFGIKDFSELNEVSSINVVEDSKESKLWTALRSSSEANFIGLSPMKLLARMPYGEATDSTEAFTFEEFKEAINHDKFLWMNPSFAIVLLLAQSYSLYGWEIGKNLLPDIKDLPLIVYRDEGQAKFKPCAEIVLTENLLEKVLAQGLIPLISFRDSSIVRLARLQSISSITSELIGRWN